MKPDNRRIELKRCQQIKEPEEHPEPVLDYAVNRNAQTAASTAVSVSKREARNRVGLAYFLRILRAGDGDRHRFEGRALPRLERTAQALLVEHCGLSCALDIRRCLGLSAIGRRLLDDLTHHFHSAAFLTIVAGTCVLGCQFAPSTPWTLVAKVLWFIGIGLWA